MANTYWNEQFVFRDILVDFDYWRCWYANKSRELAHNMQVSTMAYGSDKRQLIRVIKTANQASMRSDVCPVFVHGGYWHSQDAKDYDYVHKGLAIISTPIYNIEYRLIPHISLKEQIEDVRLALQKIHQTEGKKIALFGHSAGGHLALAACQHSYFNKDNIEQLYVLSGILDLEPITYSSLQETLSFVKQDVHRFSPLQWDTMNGIPIHLINGKKETNEYIRQSTLLYDKFHDTKEQLNLSMLEDHHHMSLVSILADEKQTQSLVAMV